MSVKQDIKRDETAELFSTVWVKMEVNVDEENEGADQEPEEEEQDQGDQEYQQTEQDKQVQENQRDEYQQADGDLGQESERPKRGRRKATTPRKRKYNYTNILTCDLCDYKTPYKHCLKYHIMDHKKLRPLSCELCDYTTKYPANLQRHIIGQHKAKDDSKPEEFPLFQCPECPYTSIFKSNLAAHMRKHCDKKFKCQECDYSTAYKHSYIKHSRTHKVKKDETYQCDKCPFVTKYEGHISRHLAQIHREVSETASKCQYCEFSTKLKWRLKIHTNRSRKKNIMNCVFCDFTTMYSCEFKIHKGRHNGLYNKALLESDYYIRNENFTYPDPNNIHKDPEYTLKDPELTPKDPEYKPKVSERASEIPNYTHEVPQYTPNVLPHTSQVSECTVKVPEYTINTDYRPDNTLNMDKDKPTRKSRSVSEPHIDNVKDQTTLINKNQYILDTDSMEIDWRSIEVNERQGQEKPYECTHCQYSAKFKASVQRHFQRHHTSQNNRPYKCVNCDFCTKTKDQIALHNKRSISTVQLDCKTCDFNTFYKCQLVMHQKTHYPYKCKLCSYSCRLTYDIQKHYSTVHLGNGLKCRYCDFKAKRKESVLTHETIHTGEKPFKCQYCEYTSVRRVLLNNHIKKKHYDKLNKPVIIADDKIASLKRTLDEHAKDFAECISKCMYDIVGKNKGDMLQNEMLGRNESQEMMASESSPAFE